MNRNFLVRFLPFRGARFRFLVLLAVLPAWGVACSGSQAEPKVRAAEPVSDVLRVELASARESVVQRKKEAVGSLLADEEVVVSNQVEGVLETIGVDLGSFVERGRLIARMDARTYHLKVAEAEANLEQALARLGRLPGDLGAIDPNATPQVREARAAFEDAQSKARRAQTLFEGGHLSEQSAVEARELLEARKAALQSTTDEVRRQIVALEGLRAQLSLARKNLSDTEIRAPLSGSVRERHVSAGEFLKVGTPVVTIVNDRRLRLRILVPEVLSASLHQGQEVEFTVDPYPSQTFTATVRRISPTLDPQSRTRQAEALVDNSDLKLAPGMFAQVSLLVGSSDRAVMVPESAIVYLAGLRKLYLLEQGKAVEREVTTGEKIDGWIEVKEGLQAGDSVIVSHLNELRQGIPVRQAASP